MARKITGMTVDMGNDQPLLDVDTAIWDLREDLGRAGRVRQAAALDWLCQKASQDVLERLHIYEDYIPGGLERKIKSYNGATGVIVLKPLSDTKASESTTITKGEIFAEAERIREERDDSSSA